jgi:hypothetical protein
MTAPLDGNALAGALGELFTVDVTTATARCDGCHHTCSVAELVVYANAPGLIGRCPACEDVLIRLVRAADRAWLDLRGLSVIQLTLPA